jgi:hypothetical protein
MKAMKKPLLAALAALATLIVVVPVASANAGPVPQALPARTLQLAVEVRAEHQCMDAAQARMESRHRRWEDEARVAGSDESHWTLQLEHEGVLDSHQNLVERHQWLMVREAEIRRSVRRAGRRITPAQRRAAERGLAEIETEVDEIETQHHTLLTAHERISRQHDEIVQTYVARNSRTPAARALLASR